MTKSSDIFDSNKEVNQFNEGDEINFKILAEKFFYYLRKSLENKIKIAVGVFVVCSLVGIYLFFIAEEKFQASIKILPETQRSALSNLGTLAAMVGLQSEGGGSTEIYDKMLRSDYVLQKVAYSKYFSKKINDSTTLLDYLKIEAPKSVDNNLSEWARFVVFKNYFVQNILYTEIDRATKILTISVVLPEPELAAQVVNKFGESLDEFVRIRRKSQASEQRYYIEKRLREVKDSLTAAEEEYKHFRERNRNIANSPQLLLEEGRYRRQIEILQAVFIELNKQKEIAKIDEIKDSPIVRIMEKAENPVFRISPKRIRSLAIAFVLSSLFFIFYYAFKDNIITALSFIKENFKSQNKNSL